MVEVVITSDRYFKRHFFENSITRSLYYLYMPLILTFSPKNKIQFKATSPLRCFLENSKKDFIIKYKYLPKKASIVLQNNPPLCNPSEFNVW